MPRCGQRPAGLAATHIATPRGFGRSSAGLNSEGCREELGQIRNYRTSPAALRPGRNRQSEIKDTNSAERENERESDSADFLV